MQTLTLQSTVLDGVISYEDSPLVKAVKWGRVLVVDEADKAPTHVTCILKTLVESGEMHLSDGRRVVSGRRPVSSSHHPSLVSINSCCCVIVSVRFKSFGLPFLAFTMTLEVLRGKYVVKDTKFHTRFV